MSGPVRRNEQLEIQSDANQNIISFNDLLDNAEVGIVRKGLIRYFFSKNPEKSVTRYRRIGMPILRKAIMYSYGNRVGYYPGSNYRTDPAKSLLERSVSYATGASIFNEIAHTVPAVLGTVYAATQAPHGLEYGPLLFSSIGANIALVGLQRYNRARMSVRANQELQDGASLNYDYRNWLGIDARAEDNAVFVISQNSLVSE